MALEFVRPTYSPVKSVNGMTGDVVVVIPEADLTGYATEAYVDKKVAEAATGGEINLDGYATKVELQKAIDEIELTPGPQGEPGKDGQDGKDYVLTEEDKAEIAGMVDVSGADVDLTDYYTKSEVDAAIEQIELTPGPQGPAGQDGYTPVKGVDYFDGKDGQDGAPGADGQDYVLTEEDKAEIAAMVEVTGGGDAVVVAGMGANSIMSKNASAAGGTDSIALGKYASAIQESTIAIGRSVQTAVENQTVIGRYNTRYTDKTFIIGNGSSSSDTKNAMMIDADNTVHFPGNVKVGADEADVATQAYVVEYVGESVMNMATTEYVDEAVAAVSGGGSSDAEQISVIIDVANPYGCSDEEANAIMALYNYYLENGTVNPNVTIKHCPGYESSNVGRTMYTIYDTYCYFQNADGVRIYSALDENGGYSYKWYHIEEGAVVRDHCMGETFKMAAGKDWVWCDTNPSHTAIAMYSRLSGTTATQIKFVGYWDDDTKYETLEYCSYAGKYAWGYDGSEPQCYVYSPQKKQTYHFKNYYAEFELYNETGTNVMGTEFHCVGCYIFV